MSSIIPPFTAEQRENLLAEAVGLVFSSWSLLQVAVANEWGGHESREKAEWLEEVLVEFVTTNKQIEQFDVEDFLFDILGEEFSCVAEDGSVEAVSKTVCKIWDELKEDTLTGLEGLRARAPAAARVVAQAIQTTEIQDSDSESDGDDEETEGDDIPVEDAKPPQRPAPDVDEDGFELVTSRRRR
ncbi:hypothetical protein H696_01030 [Fonticula alba]|uniref:Pre-rRNA-processing protein TSR2 n=1 Tax=Fonticula alba TaxID=691883 RepID=A0A058ZDS1_FONAL|nr:hypothetical protein H696_01030 [Fonticula alba]KCV71612.1 hypothetical protein H696_01030 [Fonticula alba]|eukprot:XP_009493190.1 hypothetical protein H696_01030 [Fonticula alba]